MPRTKKQKGTKVYLKKNELTTVATQVFNRLMKDDKVGALLAGGRIGLTSAFLDAVKVLPADRQPATLSQHTRKKLINSIAYHYKKVRNGDHPPAPTAPTPTVQPIEKPSIAKQTGIMIKIEGMKVEFESHRDAAVVIRALATAQKR